MNAQIIPYIFYRDVGAALDWLARAFGFTEIMRAGTPRGGIHGEMTFGGHVIMMGQGGAELEMQSVADTKVATQGVFIYLDDVDAQYKRALGADARIDRAPEDLPYGRSFTARDLEGHPWFFTTPPTAR